MKEIAERLAALGNETRLGIYRLLVRAGEKGLAVSDVRDRLELPASTLSHHLHKLIRVGLVRQERHGTTLICRADYGVVMATFDVFTRECCADDAVYQARMTGGTPCSSGACSPCDDAE